MIPGCTAREWWTIVVREAGNQEPGTRDQDEIRGLHEAHEQNKYG